MAKKKPAQEQPSTVAARHQREAERQAEARAQRDRIVAEAKKSK